MSLLYFQVPDPRPDAPAGKTIKQLDLLGPPAGFSALLTLLNLPANAPRTTAFANLSAFQRAHGVIADGMVGPYNWRLLQQAKTGKSAAGWLGVLPPEVLAKVFPFTSRKNLQIYAPYVLAALEDAGYGPDAANGALMCKAALATIRAESEGFEPISEFVSRFNTPPPGAPGAPFSLYDAPSAIAKKLGNTSPGDGARFKGRGFIQLTGRENYTRLGKQIALPLDQRSFLANLPEAAAVLLVAFLNNKAATILTAMKAGKLGEARRLVNGGAHGLDRFKDACTRWDTHIAPLMAKPGKGRGKAPKNLRKFDYTSFANDKTRFSLPVKHDPVDLRDLPYRPPLESLPELFPPPAIVKNHWGHYRQFVLDQGQEGACTGFGLACVINYLGFSRALLLQAGDKNTKSAALGSINKVSPRMLYEFARRYDEFAGQAYEGSSCRGALKGWHKHGVCAEADWPYERLVPANTAWAANALLTTLGVYYRIDKKNLVDLQAAIAEVGAVYVSAEVHAGWDPKQLKVKPGTLLAHEKLPVIAFTRGRTKSDGAHSFALVGYNRAGFIVQNSWGADWGLSGFAVLTYEDWLANSMDAWAATLGVPGVVNNAAAIPGDVKSGAAAVHLAGKPFATDSAPPSDLGTRHSLILDRGMPCKLPTDDVLQEGSLGTLGMEWPRQWFATSRPKGEPARIVLYAHGGLNSEDEGVKRARLMTEPFLNNGCYPIFMVWKTGPLESLKGALKGKSADDPKIAGNWFSDNISDKVLEKTIGPAVARPLWNEMKYAAQVANSESGGLTQLANALQSLLVQVPDLEVHLIGHSAGSILLAPMIEVLKKRRIPIAGAHLYAPACTVAFANNQWLPHVGALDPLQGTFPLRVSMLSDSCERDDNVITIYQKSLLYFIARGIEEDGPVPILGMEGAWNPEKVFDGWNGDGKTLASLSDLSKARKTLEGRGLELNILDAHRVFTHTLKSGKPDKGRSVEAAHGAFDGDAPLILDTIKRIRGGAALDPVLDLSGVP